MEVNSYSKWLVLMRPYVAGFNRPMTPYASCLFMSSLLPMTKTMPPDTLAASPTSAAGMQFRAAQAKAEVVKLDAIGPEMALQDVLEEEVTELLGRLKSERRKPVDEVGGFRNGYGKPKPAADSQKNKTVASFCPMRT